MHPPIKPLTVSKHSPRVGCERNYQDEKVRRATLMGNPSSGIAVRLDVVVAGYCSHDVQVTIVRVEIVKATFKDCP